MKKWKLIEVEHIDWKQDKSGFYTLINVVDVGKFANNVIRVDFMTSTHSPAVSFQGSPPDVRKHIARYVESEGLALSAEHIAYIGYEIARAEILGKDYIQD